MLGETRTLGFYSHVDARARERAEFLEASRVDELFNAEMLLARLQILPHREDVDAHAPGVLHRALDFVVALSEAEHDRCLREAIRRAPLGMIEHAQRLFVAGAPVANARRQAADGFQIVREDFRPGIHHDVERAQVATEIAAEDLDPRAGDAFVNRAHGIGEDQRAAVREIVAVDRGQHEIAPAQLTHRLGDAHRLEPIDDAMRAAGLHVAEAASARADVSEDHDRRGTDAPTLREVWARRFLADGV